MDFSAALKHLKYGNKVARKGWNGKGMWLIIVEQWEPWGHWEEGKRQIYDVMGKCSGKETFCPFIAMKTVDNTFVPWLASQTDMLADDWEVLS